MVFDNRIKSNAKDIWNALRTSYVVSGSMGETHKAFLDVDVGTLTPTALSIGDQIDRLAGKAIASGDTANSIAQKLRGMTDNQAVATTGGMVISSFDNALFTMTASQTVDIIPATGESDSGIIVVDTNPQAGDRVSISADTGTTYTVIMLRDGTLTWGSVGKTIDINHIGNSTGRYRIVTDATVATRTFQRVITTFK